MIIFSGFRTGTLTVAALALMAFAAPAQADTPVAVLDLAKVVATSSVGKDLQAKFKSRKEAVQKEAIAYEKDLQTKERVLVGERKKLDEAAFNEKRKEFETSLKKKRQQVLEKNIALENAKNEALHSIETKIAQISADIADSKKIQVVLDRTAVVIAQQSLDITPDVVKKLDETMKTVDLK